METLVLVLVEILKDYFWYFVLFGLATAFLYCRYFMSNQRLMKNILLAIDNRGIVDSVSLLETLRAKGCKYDANTVWMVCLDLQEEGYLKTGVNKYSLFNCHITEAGQKYLKEEDNFVPADESA
jgi:hypothetical protein